MILEPKKRKLITASTFSLSICHEVIGLDVMILVFFNIGVVYETEIDFFGNFLAFSMNQHMLAI